MDRLLIVDGMNLLFQMFYGIPARIPGPDGRPIQGTVGFVGALLKIIRSTEPTHIAVLFDGECANPRTSLDENYKANRPDYSAMPEEEVPFSQLPDIYRALDHLGIPHWETTDCEADDYIAACVRQFGGACRIVIASWDSDLWQLIGENVTVLRYRGEKTQICDMEYLRQRLGIRPEQYADHKALTGDHSDNIRGADKIGPKTAAALLGQFGSLDDILAHPEQIVRPSIRASIEKNAPRLRLNSLLIRLDGTADLPFTMEDLTWQYGGQTTSEVLRSIGLR